MSQPTIILHLLENSRAQRIAWLLEELGVDYKLKLYHRDSTGGNSELKNIHPLGKSPLIQVDKHDGQLPRVIAESGLIIDYLVKNFDINGVFKDLTPDEQLDAEYFLHFAEGSFQPLFLLFLIPKLNIARYSWSKEPNVTKFIKQLEDNTTLEHLREKFQYLESILEKNASLVGKDEPIYFVNNKFSGADVILAFGIHAAFESGFFEGSSLDISGYPFSKRYINHIKTRPALLAAKERVEREGNGEFTVGTL